MYNVKAPKASGKRGPTQSYKTVVTSMLEVPRAKPLTAESQGSQIVGGCEMDFGVKGGGKSAPARKVKRSRMY